MAVDKELKDRLDAIINGLNSLTGKKNGMSSQEGGATKKTSGDNSFEDYVENQTKENLRQIREIRRETDAIKENIFSYETVTKRLNRLNAEYAKLQDEIDEGNLTELQKTQKKLQLAHKLNEIEKERAKLQIEGYTKLDDVNLK